MGKIAVGFSAGFIHILIFLVLLITQLSFGAVTKGAGHFFLIQGGKRWQKKVFFLGLERKGKGVG
ncbi:hypothetical protein [Chryseobacterium geocarposphaerae]|uniref:Uncharacterized protein n=1 Tax=Chryseobacterium geocarposphaerae TaxID=1416776 RepID=A0ABU1LB99_9FLAO|nr:hypothetical protein [Chryseobacterium geocarposphaerae]MDR6403974.1 hypothetical protein [Chryseobacterium geocarposphaerae]MDR6698507.1 hypothetical protein [Chryseobacterium ginsenosidimutans]